MNAMLYYDTTGKNSSRPDLQITFFILKAQSPEFALFSVSFHLKQEIVRSMRIRSDYIIIPFMAVLKPSMVGRVYLKNAGPFTSASIDVDCLSNSSSQNQRIYKKYYRE